MSKLLLCEQLSDLLERRLAFPFHVGAIADPVLLTLVPGMQVLQLQGEQLPADAPLQTQDDYLREGGLCSRVSEHQKIALLHASS